MSFPKTKTKASLVGLHRKSAASADTNASALAESTISLGQISRFPEPPSSIPNSPTNSTFSSSKPVAIPAAAALSHTSARSRRLPHPPKSFVHHIDLTHSFKQSQLPSGKTSSSRSTPQTLTSHSLLTSYDWHDGASSIDIDGADDHLLPTSFITSLLQETKLKRASTSTSIALSGISDTTFAPNAKNAQHGHLSPFPSTRLMGAFPSQASYSLSPNLLEDEKSTKLKVQESLASTGAIFRRPSARASTISTLSGPSSIPDTDTFRSGDRLIQELPPVYEQDATDLREFNSSTSRHNFLSQDLMSSTQRRPYNESRPGLATRTSMYSSRSTRTFLSHVSRRLSFRRMFGQKLKPLPPVPLIPDIPFAEQQAHQQMEMSQPLPELIHRASALRAMLENGTRPHSSDGSFQVLSLRDTYYNDSAGDPGCVEREVRDLSRSGRKSSEYPWYQKFWRWYISGRRTRDKICLTVFGVVMLLVVVALVVSQLARKRKRVQSQCQGATVGSTCDINANCICTSTLQCDGLAQSVINLLPIVNTAFKSNYTAASAYSSFWLMTGGSQSSNCASQAILLDVGTGLDQSTSTNRTQWVQSALLWNALQSQDLAAAFKLQNFVQSLPWKLLEGSDGPVKHEQISSFSITSSGYIFNFASQTVTQPPASFVTLGQPSSLQIQRVSPNALAVLDRMYTYAQASSNQRQNALQKYWTSVLLQRADTLAVFKSALSASPVMLPFNATSRAIRNIYPTSSSSLFPPPLSCFPGLDPSTLRQLGVFETTIFGLSDLTQQTQFDQTCYHDRPIYGVLDILQLRLPFRDDRTCVAHQAAVLGRDTRPRAVISVGEGFSGIFNGTGSLTPSQLDPRQYGTFNFLDHVVLQYLTSISDINVATAFIKFVLDTVNMVAPVPPNPSSLLSQAMQTLPVIEVIVFGDVMTSELSSTVSPFTTDSGQLFFGSDDGFALRNWTINVAHAPVVWTENSTSTLVVRDGSLGDNPITQTWNAISMALTRQIPNIGLANITTTLTGTQSFSP